MKEDTIKLVKRAIKGNMDAYGKLIAEYQIYLYKTAFLYVKNEADSLDAVQECVIKGMLGIEKLREPRYFKTWITRFFSTVSGRSGRRFLPFLWKNTLKKGVKII